MFAFLVNLGLLKVFRFCLMVFIGFYSVCPKVSGAFWCFLFFGLIKAPLGDFFKFFFLGFLSKSK